jgi:hypothetical protein
VSVGMVRSFCCVQMTGQELSVARTVSQLGCAECGVGLVVAHAADHQLGHRVESELRGLARKNLREWSGERGGRRKVGKGKRADGKRGGGRWVREWRRFAGVRQARAQRWGWAAELRVVGVVGIVWRPVYALARAHPTSGRERIGAKYSRGAGLSLLYIRHPRQYVGGGGGAKYGMTAGLCLGALTSDTRVRTSVAATAGK